MSALVDELLKRAKVKSGMLRMGEPIAFGSDADLIDELSAELTTLQSRLEAAHEEADYANEAFKSCEKSGMEWQARAVAAEARLEAVTAERDAASESYLLAWNQRDAQRRRAEAAEARVDEIQKALAPFVAKKLPSMRRTQIGYDRYGLRRCISPFELAQVSALAALSPARTEEGKP